MKKDKHLHIGGDPRALHDYAVLRDELMKLSHPARPDVDWTIVGQRCLILFERNGVDLQTAAWYTLSRAHVAGLAGIDEGLALINALTLYHWSVLWPASEPARVEIVAGLSQRLLTILRKLALNARDELPLLYQVEKSLATLTETLVRHELKQAGRADILLHQVGQAITRLENMPREAGNEAVSVLPAQATKTAAQENAAPLVFVVHPEPAVEIAISDPFAGCRRVKAFFAGAGCAVIAIGLLLWGWNTLYAPSAVEQQLVASLTPLPTAFPAERLAALRHTQAGNERLVEQTREQLAWLMSLPPDWPLRYGQRLVSQAQAIWPDNPDIAGIAKAWQQQREATALEAAALTGWHNGMEKLQRLADRLNGLDEKRGKYMTVSELKSEVFGVTQAFNQYPPSEELLRLLGETQLEKGAIQVHKQQSELRLRQLLMRYALHTEGDETVVEKLNETY